MPNFLAICFIVVIIMMTTCTLCIINAIEDLTDAVNESKQQQQVVDAVAYEEPEEIVTVTYEKQEDGDMIYEFGDVSDDAYFFIIINEEQGIYEYYWPTMSEDWPLAYDSLEELNESIICHIDQEWPNARFVMRSN